MEIKVIGGSMDAVEKKMYADYIREKYPDKIITELTIVIDGEFVNLDFKYDNVPFERIRRITGKRPQ